MSLRKGVRIKPVCVIQLVSMLYLGLGMRERSTLRPESSGLGKWNSRITLFCSNPEPCMNLNATWLDIWRTFDFLDISHLLSISDEQKILPLYFHHRIHQNIPKLRLKIGALSTKMGKMGVAFLTWLPLDRLALEI